MEEATKRTAWEPPVQAPRRPAGERGLPGPGLPSRRGDRVEIPERQRAREKQAVGNERRGEWHCLGRDRMT